MGIEFLILCLILVEKVQKKFSSVVNSIGNVFSSVLDILGQKYVEIGFVNKVKVRNDIVDKMVLMQFVGMGLYLGF